MATTDPEAPAAAPAPLTTASLSGSQPDSETAPASEAAPPEIPAKEAKAGPKPGSFGELQARGKALGLKVVGVTKAQLEAAIAGTDAATPEPVGASVKEAIKVTKAAAKAGQPVEVVESFTTLIKATEVHYRKGELVHPEDPVLSRSAELFRPAVYPHGRNGLGNPEVRS